MDRRKPDFGGQDSGEGFRGRLGTIGCLGIEQIGAILKKISFVDSRWRVNLEGYSCLVTPLPHPRSIGIIGLGENPAQNIGVQSLRGKILISKSIVSANWQELG
jgi:hypothetical protein